MNRAGPEDRNETKSSDPRGDEGDGGAPWTPHLSERDAGGRRRTLCRFQVLQKFPDAAVTRGPLRNAEVPLPRVPRALLEAEAPLVQRSPGVAGRRWLGDTLDICHRGGQQLSGAEMEPVDLRRSEHEKLAWIQSRRSLGSPAPNPSTY